MLFLAVSAFVVIAVLASGGNFGSDEGWSAFFSVLAAVLVLFGFFAEHDDQLKEWVADTLKALGVGVAVPMAVLTSNAGLTCAGRVGIIAAVVILGLAFVVASHRGETG